MMKYNLCMVDRIRDFVETECRKPTSKYGFEPFTTHFVPMVRYAKSLARSLKANEEIVEIAAWMHDIGSIIHGRENHHITGAEIAKQKLEQLGYPEDKIKLVIDCILNHRGSVINGKSTLEEQIIADADGLAAFDRIEGLFMAAFVFEKKSQSEARISVRQKISNSYSKLSDSAKKLIKPKYDAAMLLLGTSG